MFVFENIKKKKISSSKTSKFSLIVKFLRKKKLEAALKKKLKSEFSEKCSVVTIANKYSVSVSDNCLTLKLFTIKF